MVHDWRRWRRAGAVLLWTLLGGVIVGSFFVAAFFADYAPVATGDPGAVLLLVPMIAGLLLGILLTDEEIVVAAGAGLLAATFAVVLIGIFLFSPLLAGVAPATRATEAYPISRTVLSSILLFPLVVVGSVIGRGIGDLFLPSTRMRAELEKLREETRRWHEALDRLEARSREAYGGETKPPPSEPREERKG